MSIFETIKAAVSVPQAAAYYGMKIQRNHMTRCCFHDDHHPSMKLNDTYYYCFACLEHGDVIDLVAQLHRESHYAAVQRIARDFGIGPPPRLRQRQSHTVLIATLMKPSA